MAGKAQLKITIDKGFLKSEIASAIKDAGTFQINAKVHVDDSELTNLANKIKGLEKSKIHVALTTNGDGKTNIVGATEKYALKELDVQKQSIKSLADSKKAFASLSASISKENIARIKAEEKAESAKNKMIADGLKSQQKIREQDNASRRKLEQENAKQDTVRLKADEARATADYKAQVRERERQQKEVENQAKAAKKAQEQLADLYNKADQASTKARDLAGANYLNESVVKGSPAAINALNQLKEAASALDAVKEKIKNADGSNLKGLQQELKDATAKFNEAKKSAAEFSDSFVNSPKYLQNVAKLEKATSDMRQYMNKNSAIKNNASLYAEGQSIIDSTKNMSASSADIATLNSQWSAYKAKVMEAGLAHSSFASSFKSALGSVTKYFSATMIVYKGIAKVKEAVKSLREYDTILTEISKATGENKKEFDGLLNTAYDTASGYGTSVEGYLTGVQEMARAGFRGDQMTGLANLSALAQSAGAMSDDLANQLLIAANAAWQMNGNVEQLNTALDGMVNVSNNNAVNMTSLSTAFTKVASQGASAGISIGELTAMLGTIKASTQLADTTVGQSMKGILMNLQQVKGEVGEGEEITEADLTKYEKSAAALGVSLKEMKEGTLVTRDTVTVLKELSQAYNSLPDRDVRKANLLSSIGGKLRANALDALLKNWDTYEKQLEEFNNADNVASEMAAKTANSWEGRLQALSNNWNKFVGTFVDSDLMTFLTGTASGIIGITSSITDLVGAIPMLTGAISAFMSAKNNTGFFKTYMDADGNTRVGTFWKANAVTRQNIMKANVDSITQLFGGVQDGDEASFNAAMNAARQRANELGGAYSSAFNSTLSGKKTISDVRGAFAQFNDQVASQVDTTTKSIGSRLKNGFKNIAATIGSSLVSMGISMALSLAFQGIQGAIQAPIKAAQESAKSAVDTDNNLKSIDDYKEKITDLKKSLDSGNLSEAEAYNARVELAGIQKEIIENFGAEASALDLLNDSLDTTNNKLNELSKNEMREWLAKNTGTAKDAYNFLNGRNPDKATDYGIPEDFGVNYWFGRASQIRTETFTDKEKQFIKDNFLNKYKLTLDDDGSYYMEDMFTNNSFVFTHAESRAEMLKKAQDLYDEVTEKINGGKYVGNQDAISALEKTQRAVSNYISYINDENYQNNITAAEHFAEYTAATGEEYADVYDSIKEFQKKYVEGNLSNDTNDVKNRIHEFKQLQKTFENMEIDEGTDSGRAVKQYFTEQLAELEKQFNKDEFRLALDNVGIEFNKRGLKRSEEDLKKALGDGDFNTIFADENINVDALSEAARQRYEVVKDVADAYGMSIKDLVAIAGEYGYGIDKAMSANLRLENSLSNMTSKVTSFTSAQEAMTKALSEQEQIGTITADTLADLEANFGDLTGILEDTGLGLSVNTIKLRELAQSQAEAANNDLRGALSETEDLFNNNASIISYYQENMQHLTQAQREDYQARLEYNNSLSDTIEKYALLSAQLEYATSGYKAWMDAQSAPDTGDVQESARSAYEYLNKVYNYDENSADEYGRVGSVKATAASQFLIPQDVLDKGEESVRNYIDNIKKYMTGGIDSAQAYISDLVGAGLATQSDTGEFEIKPNVELSDVEKKLHITHDLATALFGELEEYGIDVKFNDEFNTQLDSMVAKFQAAKDKALEIQELESSLTSMTANPEDAEMFSAEIGATRSKIQEARAELDGFVSDLWKAGQQGDIDIEAQFGVKSKDELTNKILNGEITVEDINADIVTPDADNLDTIQAKVKELEEPVNISFEWDLDSFNSISEQISKKIEAMKNGDVDELSIPISADDSPAQKVLEKVQAQKLAEKLTKIFAVDNTGEGVSKAKATTNSVQDKKVNITTSFQDNGGVGTFFRDIFSNLKDKTVNINTKQTTTKTTIFETLFKGGGKKGGTSGTVNGTAHINGTAYRNGNWGASEDSIALTGELGQELVVRGNKWFTVGDHGAEFVPIHKGDIVFNHKQTEDLFRHGYVVGRGQAFLEGTAYANPTVGAKGKLTTPPAPEVNINTDKVNIGGKQGSSSSSPKIKDKTKDTKKTESAFDKMLKTLDDFFDWIEIKLARAARNTEKKVNKIEQVTHRGLTGYIASKTGDYVKAGGRYYNVNYDYDSKKRKFVKVSSGDGDYYLAGTNKNGQPIYRKVSSKTKRYARGGGQLDVVNQAIAATASEIRINKKAYEKYREQATTVANTINKTKLYLPSNIIKAIQNGTIKISEYSENRRKAIEEYKKWYDKAQDALKNAEELQQKQHELQMRKLEVIDKYYNNRINRWSSDASIRENYIEYVDTAITGEGKLFSDKQKQKIQNAYSKQRSDLELQSKYWSTNVSKLQSQLKSLVKKGAVKKYSDEWYEWTEKINTAAANVQSTKTAIEELDNSESELMRNNIESHFSSLANVNESVLNRLQAGINRISAAVTDEGLRYSKDQTASIISNYQSQRQQLKATMDLYNKEATTLQDEMNRELKKGRITKNDSDWMAYTIAIKEAATNAKNAEAEIAKIDDDLTATLLDNLTNYYELRTSYYNDAVNEFESQLNSLIAQGKETEENERQSFTSRIETQTKALNKYKEELNDAQSLLSSLMDAGEIVKGDAQWFELTATIVNLKTEINNMTANIADLGRELNEIKLKRLDQALDRLQAIRDVSEALINLNEVQEEEIRDSQYVDQIANIDNELSNLNQQYIELINEQQLYESGSDLWYELENSILDNQKAVLNLKKTQESYYDSIIDLQVKALKKKKEEFEELNDAADKQLKLEKALEALERARTQRTKLVYRENQGFVYEADQDAIRQAAEDLDNIYYDAILDDFDKAIKELEDLKADLNIYDRDAQRKTDTEDIISTVNEASNRITNALDNNLDSYNNGTYVPHYAGGAKSVRRSGYANVDEMRPELIARGRYTWLEKGDTVFPSFITDNLWSFGRNPQAFLSQILDNNLSDINLSSNKIETTNVNINGDLSFPNITSATQADSFVKELNKIALKATQRVQKS